MSSAPSAPRSWFVAVVALAVISCTAPTGQPTQPSGSSRQADPTSAVAGDPGASASPEPTAEPSSSTAPPAFTWTRLVLPGLEYRSVLAVRGQHLALGPAIGDDLDQVSVLRSEDGVTWGTLARRPFDGQLPRSMTLVDGRLIVIAFRSLGPERAEAVVWWSKDGKAWAVWIDSPRIPHPEAFARFGDRWLLQSEFGGGIQSSRDGAEWTTDVALHAAVEGAGFAIGPAGVLAPITQEGENGPGRSWLLLSADGVEWKEVPFQDDTWIQLTAGNDTGYVAFGVTPYSQVPIAASRAWWSADGEHWDRAVVPDEFGASASYVRQIVSYDGGFLAAANAREEGPARMLWSEDGQRWAYVDDDPEVPSESTGLTVDGSRVLWFGYEFLDSDVRVLWEATPA
jgi:hypothetical protein